MYFKALGLALMLVELIWFIALPIYKEFRHWHSKRTGMTFNRQTLRSLMLALMIVLIFTVPWHTRIEGAGLLAPEHLAVLYIKQPAMMLEKKVTSGSQVKKGDVLLRFTSPELDKRIELARQKVTTLRAKVATASLDPELRFTYALDVQEMQAATSELNGLIQDQQRLTIVTPIDGTLHDVPLWLQNGAWVPENTQLGLVSSHISQVTAYVAEEDMERLYLGASGTFYPLSGYFAPLALRVLSIGSAAVRDIVHKELPTTVVGGIIPARKAPDGRIVPEQALYKVICAVENSETLPNHSLSGTVSLQGTRQSFAIRLWQAGVGLLIRESGLD